MLSFWWPWMSFLPSYAIALDDEYCGIVLVEQVPMWCTWKHRWRQGQTAGVWFISSSKRGSYCCCVCFQHPRTLKLMTDDASLRLEFPVSTGRKPIKNPPLRHFACILRHNATFLPIEIRNMCLSEAPSVISLGLSSFAFGWRWSFVKPSKHWLVAWCVLVQDNTVLGY